MAFAISLTPTTKTGGAKAFNAGVVRALSALGAQHSSAAETVRLADRTQIHLFLSRVSDAAEITTETMTAEVARAVYRLAEATASVVAAAGRQGRTPAGGDMVSGGSAGVQDLDTEAQMSRFLQTHFDAWKVEEKARVLVQEAEAKVTNDARFAAVKTARHPMPDLVSKPSSSLLRRLSDALFGKSL
jgi:hypothetical protein